MVESPGSFCVSAKQINGKLEITFGKLCVFVCNINVIVFGREHVLGMKSDEIKRLSLAVSTFKDRLRAEVISSKVRLSADIRTAISQTSRMYASHSGAGIRGA